MSISGNWEWLTFENTSWRNWEGSCVRETEHWERICIEGKKCGVIYEACGSDGKSGHFPVTRKQAFGGEKPQMSQSRRKMRHTLSSFQFMNVSPYFSNVKQ